ncbi:MAG: 1-acyl-sn-glycerol-3-phosphate acyltransferase [Clostridia bacterium]|nr:1-acyl-sn-glycerol-3-phosphate acyltransferase [Clostridia bacterium]
MKHIFRIFAKIMTLWSIGLGFRVRIRHESKEHRQSTFFFKGPAVIISNHNHFLDFVILLYVFAFRYIRCIVGKTLYESSKFLEIILKGFGCIKVDRFSFDMEFFFKAMDVLKKKGVVLIFPEGKFSVDGSINEFKSTAALLALQAGVPIIPVYHTANYGAFKRTDIMVGDRIYLKDYIKSKNPSEKELLELTEMLRNKILELKDLSEKGGGVK